MISLNKALEICVTHLLILRWDRDFAHKFQQPAIYNYQILVTCRKFKIWDEILQFH
jgi:hypothetical protein